jgi:hypothetical protein
MQTRVLREKIRLSAATSIELTLVPVGAVLLFNVACRALAFEPGSDMHGAPADKGEADSKDVFVPSLAARRPDKKYSPPNEDADTPLCL